jgi:hypothetical protein
MEEKMITVKLVDYPVNPALEVMSFAASGCYNAHEPKFGKIINVKEKTWDKSHHTIAEHQNYVFSIQNIAVGDITLGLHLVSPFYDSSQRSGRFCGDMFSDPNSLEVIMNYIHTIYDSVVEDRGKFIFERIYRYLLHCMSVYNDNIGQATKIAAQWIREERPYVSEEYIEKNAPKIAQEQLRVSIPVIFPTGIIHSLNLTALATLYRNAWSEPLMDVTEKMKNAVLEKQPELAFLFSRAENAQMSDSGGVFIPDFFEVINQPSVVLNQLDDSRNFIIPAKEDMYPIDSLFSMPKYMNNKVHSLGVWAEMSLATMGQDQRHRTIDRGMPRFTGHFYLPPIPHSIIGLDKKGLEIIKEWKDLVSIQFMPNNLIYTLAPYGIMMRYYKKANFNAFSHEMFKRICWSAQEEIQFMAILLAQEIIKKEGKESRLLQILRPPCAFNGKCAEGDRYCGRDLNKLEEQLYMRRRV